MNTTAVFVEILIIGLEAGVWVALLLADLFGTAWIAPAALRGWEDAAIVAGLATAYVFGIFVDRAADSTYGWILGTAWGRALAGAGAPRSLEGHGNKRLYVMAKSDGIARFVDYQRSRLRIARATVFNVFLALVFALAFLIARAGAGTTRVLMAAIGGIVLWIILLRLAERIARAAEDRLQDAYELLRSDKAP